MSKRTKLYKNVIIDPPWDINQKGRFGACKHYSLMSIEQIRAMPIADLLEENAALWLWVTNSTIYEGYQLLKDWGLNYRSICTWFKFRPQLGLGNYLRNCTEHVLLATRGKMPIQIKNQPSWFIAPVTDHSHKPEEFHAIAERCYPGPNLELFARRPHPGWDVWGNEVLSDIEIPGYPVPHVKGKEVA